MKQFIDHLTERNFRNRKVAFIENGSWGPVAAKKMKSLLEGAADLVMSENVVTIKSSLTDDNIEQLKLLAAELADMACTQEAHTQTEEAKPAKALKKYECKICGYVYEGESLPADYECPLCGRGAEDFALVE